MYSTHRGTILLRYGFGRFLPLLLGTLVACADSDTDPAGPGGGGGSDGLGFEQCDLRTSFIADGGVGRNGIPSLTDPPVATPGSSDLDYLRPDDRVIGFFVDGQAYAVPHNILWWHEIVNFNLGDSQLAITLCPLTGTSLGFDRSSIGGDELGVSGLLYQANLIMFNRGDPESLWPQMLSEARCGAEVGEELARYPVVETTWDAWEELHPNTLTVTDDTGHPARDYQRYPYGSDYESEGNASFLGFPMPELDPRRPPKERVIGVPPSSTPSETSDPSARGIAIPFGALRAMAGGFAVLEFTWEGEPAVVLWSDAAEGGMVYRPRTDDGQEVELTAPREGITDVGTGSRWSVDGRAVSGELAGSQLVPVKSAYTAFWGAWSAFFPQTDLRER